MKRYLINLLRALLNRPVIIVNLHKPGMFDDCHGPIIESDFEIVVTETETPVPRCYFTKND